MDMLILKNILFYNVNTFYCCRILRIVGIVNLKFLVFDELLAYPLKTKDLRLGGLSTELSGFEL